MTPPENTSKNTGPGNTGIYPETAYSKVVCYYRRQTECTQDEFAVACGIGITTLQDIESGRVKKPRLDTEKRIVIGLQSLGVDVDLDGFDAKVAEYELPVPQNANLNYTDPHYAPDTTKSREDLTCLLIHIPAARKIVSEISKHNSEMRFVRGITNTLNRIEKMAEADRPFELETFCTLMKQFDSYVQEAERKKLKDEDDIFSLKRLREKLDGFEDELGKFYPEYKDGLIPNDWPCENIKHHDLIEALFSEIQQRKFKIEDINDIDFRNKGLNTLEELEIELDRNPLHLKNINSIRARLEELDRNIFKELLISSQLLLGIYAEQLTPGSVFRDTREAPEMVVIPAGEFLIGYPDDEEAYVDEISLNERRRVKISNNFAVGRYAITFEEWDRYRQDHPEVHNPDDEGWGKERRPVINVSWDDTKGFLEWLEGQTKMPYRLLSEAEWEYVCRADTDTEYHFGDDEGQLKDYAWYDENSEEKTQPVGLKKPSQFGLYDMHGNVWEWCEDHWFADYRWIPKDGSARLQKKSNDNIGAVGRGNIGVVQSHPISELGGVLRGGSCSNDSSYLCARNRIGENHGYRSGLLGFRVARTLVSNQA